MPITWFFDIELQDSPKRKTGQRTNDCSSLIPGSQWSADTQACISAKHLRLEEMGEQVDQKNKKRDTTIKQGHPACRAKQKRRECEFSCLRKNALEGNFQGRHN